MEADRDPLSVRDIDFFFFFPRDQCLLWTAVSKVPRLKRGSPVPA